MHQFSDLSHADIRKNMNCGSILPLVVKFEPENVNTNARQPTHRQNFQKSYYILGSSRHVLQKRQRMRQHDGLCFYLDQKAQFLTFFFKTVYDKISLCFYCVHPK